MKRLLVCVLALLAICLTIPVAAQAADEIKIGVPTSLGFLEGKEAFNAVKMAVDEINAAGGVKVGGKSLPIKVVSIDIRDAAPGVPVPEALLGIEKLILEERPQALVVGPFRSEALMAAMDLLAKHKVLMLGTIAMAPQTEAKVAKDPKYKFIFRTCLNGKYLVGYLVGSTALIKKEFGFNKVYIMNQDVAWARGTAKVVFRNPDREAEDAGVGCGGLPHRRQRLRAGTDEGQDEGRRNHPAHFRHAPKWHPGKAMVLHEDSGHDGRFCLSGRGSVRLEGF